MVFLLGQELQVQLSPQWHSSPAAQHASQSRKLATSPSTKHVQQVFSCQCAPGKILRERSTVQITSHVPHDLLTGAGRLMLQWCLCKVVNEDRNEGMQASPQVQPLGPVQEPQRPALPLTHVLHSQLSAHWQLAPEKCSEIRHVFQATHDESDDGSLIKTIYCS